MSAARLPALTQVKTADPSMRSWMQAVTERLEVREGSRGSEAERAVTVRELDALKATLTASSSTTSATATTTTLDEQLRSSSEFRGLKGRVDILEEDSGASTTAVVATAPSSQTVRAYVQATDPGAVGAGAFWVQP